MFGVKAYAALGSILIIVGIGAWLYQQGRAAERIDTRTENVDAAEKAIQSAGDWRSCIDAYGVWNFATAKCQRSARGGGE